MHLGDYIARYRKDANLTIDELASMSGVPKGTINKIIAGTTKSPTLETVRSLADALGKTLDDFEDSPRGKREALSVSEEAQELAKDYDGLDDHGKRLVRLIVDEEKARCKEAAEKAAFLKMAEDLYDSEKEPDTPVSSLKESGVV